jgi:hypothetical protein
MALGGVLAATDRRYRNRTAAADATIAAPVTPLPVPQAAGAR